MARLAIDGGDPVRTEPFPPWPSFTDDEIASVADVLRSGQVNYWTGPLGRRFEELFAQYIGIPHALAVMNGTIALQAALEALRLSPGDEVIVPARTFVATANSVILAGGRPVFADIDLTSQCVTADTAAAAITERTRGIIPVHLGGWPAPMTELGELAASANLFLLEDCAQALGATYDGRLVGSLSDVAAFSFCQDKIITTGGEGGMMVTSDTELWSRAWSLRDQGKSYDRVMGQESEGWGVAFCWLNVHIGSNWRMTEMQSALGISGLSRLDELLSTRRTHAGFLDEAFSTIPGLRVTIPSEREGHSYYRYYAFVVPEAMRPDWDRDRIAAAINAEGVPCFTGSCPEVYLEDSFVSHGLAPATRLPNARELGVTSLMFLVHPTLSPADMDDTAEAVSRVMRAATR